MLFRRSALIDFYDHPNSWVQEVDGRGSHVSALTGVMGEDVVLGALLHHWASKGHSPRIVSYQCNTGEKKGKRLDAWILRDKKTIFQVEVKNWSGHSLGRYNLPRNATKSVLSSFAEKRWQRYFGNSEKLPDEIKKVLDPMEVPSGYTPLEQKKLLCFWFYVVDSSARPYCTHTMDADELDVFSASAYLRSLDEESIDLVAPRVEARMRLLDSLVVHQAPNPSIEKTLPGKPVSASNVKR